MFRFPERFKTYSMIFLLFVFVKFFESCGTTDNFYISFLCVWLCLSVYLFCLCFSAVALIQWCRKRMRCRSVFLHKLRKCSFIMKRLTVFIWVTAVLEFWRNSRWYEIVSNAAKTVRWSRCWFFVFVVTLVVVILSWWDDVFYDVIIGHFGWCYQIIVNCCVFFYTTRRLPRLHHQNVCCLLVTGTLHGDNNLQW